MATYNFTGTTHTQTGSGALSAPLPGSAVSFTYTFQGGTVDLDPFDFDHYAGTFPSPTATLLPATQSVSGALSLTGNNAFTDVQLNFETPPASVAVSVVTQSGATVALTAPSAAYSGVVTGIKFTLAPGAHFSLTSVITSGLVCYLEGTGIATSRGRVAVEDLRPGDTLIKADGGTTTLKWIGKQRVSTRFTNPAKTFPVCISKNAIGDGVPKRDLFVSPDHAIGIENYLVNASALVNGTTVRQLARIDVDSIVYFHLETDQHELILAENCPAESYVDYAPRSAFDTAQSAEDVIINEMSAPRISTPRLVPAHIQRRLAKSDAA